MKNPQNCSDTLIHFSEELAHFEYSSYAYQLGSEEVEPFFVCNVASEEFADHQ